MINLIKWIMIVLTPFVLGFGTITGIIAWDYPAWEYDRIPPDTYGWTAEERLENANATLAYLQSWESAEEAIVMLEELQLPEDPNQPLYKDSEIKHMIDVKVWSDRIRNIFLVGGVLLLFGLLYFFSQSELRPAAVAVLYRGGLTTVVVLAAIAIFILVGWSLFFVAFHELLFPPGTWTFFYTDSLIRLFPEQFWFDVGVIISVGTLVEGIILTAIGYLLRRS